MARKLFAALYWIAVALNLAAPIVNWIPRNSNWILVAFLAYPALAIVAMLALMLSCPDLTLPGRHDTGAGAALRESIMRSAPHWLVARIVGTVVFGLLEFGAVLVLLVVYSGQDWPPAAELFAPMGFAGFALLFPMIPIFLGWAAALHRLKRG